MGTPGEHVERLAQHALRGEVWEKAVQYLGQAGAQGGGALALPESGVASSRPWGCCLTGGQPATREQGIELRLELRPILSLLGEFRGCWSGWARRRPSPTLDRRPPAQLALARLSNPYFQMVDWARRGDGRRGAGDRRATRGARPRILTTDLLGQASTAGAISCGLSSWPP